MKINVMPWEKRNLNVSSVQYYFEETDTFDDTIQSTLLHSDYDYELADLPVGKIDLLHQLENSGFHFIETKVKISKNLTESSSNSDVLNLFSDFNYHAASACEEEFLFEEIRKGIFCTDKVSLDPYFGIEAAGMRYMLWAKNELRHEDSTAYIVNLGNVPIGFFILKERNNICNPFLAGLFHQKDDKGMGLSLVYYQMLQAKKDNMKKIIGDVSSNNLSSLRMYLMFGYEIKTMRYILVRHSR